MWKDTFVGCGIPPLLKSWYFKSLQKWVSDFSIDWLCNCQVRGEKANKHSDKSTTPSFNGRGRCLNKRWKKYKSTEGCSREYVWNGAQVFGHCQNSDCTPPQSHTDTHSNGHSGALYCLADLSKCHLNFNFHCISAPNHPGKGLDPPSIKQMPVWTW